MSDKEVAIAATPEKSDFSSAQKCVVDLKVSCDMSMSDAKDV